MAAILGKSSFGVDNAPDGQFSRYRRVWHFIALGTIVFLAALLNFYRLVQTGALNVYYAAGVKSMMMSWHNFFFVSFDPVGFVTLDELPLGFWIQVASAKVFGFDRWGLLFPQALAGFLSVILLYHLVKRTFGRVAGSLAALGLALTPISVIASRSTTVDMLLVLTSLLAAWAVSYAAKAGSLRWLLVSAVLVGLGFNIKMLQAYLVVPALGLVYLLGTPLSWQKRVQHLALALLVLLVISFSWIAVVDLTPASQRPYVGSSGTNSEMGLVFGYNGLQRLFGISAPGSGQPNGEGSANASNATLTSAVFTQGESGSPGLFRLFNEYLGGLVGWFLPMALLGFLFVVWQEWWHRPFRPSKLEPLTPRQQGLVLWGVWLLTVSLFLSMANLISPYYTVLLVSAVAAFFGIGIVAFWQAYHQPGWEGWLLPCVLFISAVVQAILLRAYPGVSVVLTPVVMGLTLIAVVGLACKRILQFMAIRRLRDEFENVENRVVTPSDFAATRRRFTVPFVTIGIMALLIVPALWDNSVMFNNASPDAGATSGSSGASSRASFNETVNQLERFLISNQEKAQFILATPSAMIAAPLILDTDKAVMALGGFSGADRILTSQQLAVLVKLGVVRFFLLSDGYGDRNGDLLRWVKDNCAVVPPSRWHTSSAGTSGNFPDFFDCAGA